MSENIYTWEFDDVRDRWSMWYVIALSIVLGLSIWWIFTKQYWMSFIVLLLSGLVYFVDNNSEDTIQVKITEFWIMISSVFYDFTSIDSFWIVYKWEEPVFLRLNLNKKWLKNIDVKITNEITSDLKQILPNYIQETEKVEISFSEKMIERFKL